MKKFLIICGIHLVILFLLMLLDYPFGPWYWNDVFKWSRKGASEKLVEVPVQENDTIDVAVSTNALPAFSDSITAEGRTRLEVYEVKRRKQTWAQKRVHRLLNNDFWAFFEQFGLIWAGILVCIFIWEYYPDYRRYILLFIISSILTGITVVFIKQLTGKLRPGLTEGVVTYLPLFEGMGRTNGVCFPSGHTTQAFVLATFLACLYPRLRVFFYIIAAITGSSRIVTTAHWPSDVYGGAILGYASTKGLFILYQQWQEKIQTILAKIPLIGNNRETLSIGDAAPPVTRSNGDALFPRKEGSDAYTYTAICFLSDVRTPSCITQLKALEKATAAFDAQNIHIVCVAQDTPENIQKYCEKNKTSFAIVSDVTGVLKHSYGCESMFGGHTRNWTFIISPEGIVADIFKHINAAHHDKEIIGAVRACAMQ